jgi:putative ABC transport system permease protein
MLRDVRFALRSFLKTPGFTAVVVAVLALGIGANTAIFSVVNAVLLRPLPYKDSERLVMLWGNVRRQVVERRGASFPDFVDWRDRSRSFDSMAAVWDSTFTLYGVDVPERVHGEVVSAGYFSLLGITPLKGRAFRPDEDRKPGITPVAIIGEGFWKRRLGADPAIVGRAIQLDNRSFAVIGVAPGEFRGMSDEAEIWIPAMAVLDAEEAAERGTRWFPAVARLKRGANREQAQAELDVISEQLQKAYPNTNEKRAVEVAPLVNEVFGEIRPALLVILGAVGFVLLIACANVASLLLGRAEARNREIAIRAALGALRRDLLRQLGAEALTLSFAGGTLGLLVAEWGIAGLMAASPVEFPTYVKVHIDEVAIAFTAILCLGTGAVLGVAPAFMVPLKRLHDALRDASSRTTFGRASLRFRSALVTAEVALSLILLVGAGLLIRSFQRLSVLNPGFRPEGLLTLRVSLPRLPEAARGSPAAAPEPDPRAISASRQILESLRPLPGLTSAALVSDVPLSGEGGAIFYTAEGQPPVNAQNMPRAYLHRVSPGFFTTLGIRLLHGRDFSQKEMQGEDQAVIVSENVVRRFWPGRDPIGKRVKGGGPNSKSPWLTIVGVVDETKYRGLPRNPTPDPDVYLPFSERARNFAVLVRTAGDPAGLAGSVQDAVRSVDKTAVTYNVLTMTERVRRQMARSRFTSWLMGIFAGIAVALAMIGLYGVMAHSVEQRTREIGIRMALGAAREEILRMVALRGLIIAGVGALIGIGGALALTRFMEGLLYGVSPRDWLVFAAVTLAILLIAALASYIPARRATRVDPMTALRYE